MDRRQFRACACSRETARSSRWTVAMAAATLCGLHDAGLLDVAHGGGEPFAFRGFADRVAELDTTTTLAQHPRLYRRRILSHLPLPPLREPRRAVIAAPVPPPASTTNKRLLHRVPRLAVAGA